MEKVKHKITGEVMTVKKDYGSVVSCLIEKPDYMFTNVLMDTVICLKESLEPLPFAPKEK